MTQSNNGILKNSMIKKDKTVRFQNIDDTRNELDHESKSSERSAMEDEEKEEILRYSVVYETSSSNSKSTPNPALSEEERKYFPLFEIISKVRKGALMNVVAGTTGEDPSSDSFDLMKSRKYNLDLSWANEDAATLLPYEEWKISSDQDAFSIPISEVSDIVLEPSPINSFRIYQDGQVFQCTPLPASTSPRSSSFAGSRQAEEQSEFWADAIFTLLDLHQSIDLGRLQQMFRRYIEDPSLATSQHPAQDKCDDSGDKSRPKPNKRNLLGKMKRIFSSSKSINKTKAGTSTASSPSEASSPTVSSSPGKSKRRWSSFVFGPGKPDEASTSATGSLDDTISQSLMSYRRGSTLQFKHSNPMRTGSHQTPKLSPYGAEIHPQQKVLDEGKEASEVAHTIEAKDTSYPASGQPLNPQIQGEPEEQVPRSVHGRKQGLDSINEQLDLLNPRRTVSQEIDEKDESSRSEMRDANSQADLTTPAAPIVPTIRGPKDILGRPTVLDDLYAEDQGHFSQSLAFEHGLSSKQVQHFKENSYFKEIGSLLYAESLKLSPSSNQGLSSPRYGTRSFQSLSLEQQQHQQQWQPRDGGALAPSSLSGKKKYLLVRTDSFMTVEDDDIHEIESALSPEGYETTLRTNRQSIEQARLRRKEEQVRKYKERKDKLQSKFRDHSHRPSTVIQSSLANLPASPREQKLLTILRGSSTSEAGSPFTELATNAPPVSRQFKTQQTSPLASSEKAKRTSIFSFSPFASAQVASGASSHPQVGGPRRDPSPPFQLYRPQPLASLQEGREESSEGDDSFLRDHTTRSEANQTKQSSDERPDKKKSQEENRSGKQEKESGDDNDIVEARYNLRDSQNMESSVSIASTDRGNTRDDGTVGTSNLESMSLFEESSEDQPDALSRMDTLLRLESGSVHSRASSRSSHTSWLRNKSSMHTSRQQRRASTGLFYSKPQFVLDNQEILNKISSDKSFPPALPTVPAASQMYDDDCLGASSSNIPSEPKASTNSDSLALEFMHASVIQRVAAQDALSEAPDESESESEFNSTEDEKSSRLSSHERLSQNENLSTPVPYQSLPQSPPTPPPPPPPPPPSRSPLSNAARDLPTPSVAQDVRAKDWLLWAKTQSNTEQGNGSSDLNPSSRNGLEAEPSTIDSGSTAIKDFFNADGQHSEPEDEINAVFFGLHVRCELMTKADIQAHCHTHGLSLAPQSFQIQDHASRFFVAIVLVSSQEAAIIPIEDILSVNFDTSHSGLFKLSIILGHPMFPVFHICSSHNDERSEAEAVQKDAQLLFSKLKISPSLAYESGATFSGNYAPSGFVFSTKGDSDSLDSPDPSTRHALPPPSPNQFLQNILLLKKAAKEDAK